jgi:hypothetical protein
MVEPPHPEPGGVTPPSMTAWGRKAARAYLVVGALALVAMLVETVLGHAGTGTMIAAILAAPWSMLVAGMAPPLPRDWPMAAGLAVRMLPLALFMLLNAAIVASIAARSERDLRGTPPQALLLLVLPLLVLSSGCGLTSRQVVLLTAPTSVLEFSNGGDIYTLLTFDLTQVRDWNEHRGKFSEVSELSLMGDFANPTDGPFQPTSALDVEIGLSSGLTGVGTEPTVWAGPHLEPGARMKVAWDEGARRLVPAAAALRNELRTDGQFTLVVRSVAPPATQALATVSDFHLGAVLQVK